MCKPGAAAWRRIAIFISSMFVALVLSACGGGGTDNDCSGGQDVYTNISYPQSFDLYRLQLGIAVPAVAPETRGIPQRCLSSRRFSIASGTLPPGLRFEPLTGIVSGTPSEEGYFEFTVRVELDGFEGSVTGGLSSRVAVRSSYGFASWKTTEHPDGVLLVGSRDADLSRLDRLGNSLLVLGAGSGGVMSAQVSSDDGLTWATFFAGDPPPNAEGFATGAHESLLYVSGGSPTYSQDYRSELWAFDGAVWSAVPASSSFPARRDHRLVSFGGALYALGGRNSSGQLSDVWRSSDGGESWRQTAASFSSEAGQLMCAFAMAGKLVALTGHTGSAFGSQPRTRIWESPDGTNWSEVAVGATSPLKALEPLAQQCVVLDDGRAYVLGLFEAVSTADLRTWRFEPDPRNSGPAPGGAAVNGKIFVIGNLGTSTPTLSQTVPR